MLAGSYILRSAAAACLIRALLMRLSHARCTPSERLATNLVSSGHPNILRHSELRTCIRARLLCRCGMAPRRESAARKGQVLRQARD